MALRIFDIDICKPRPPISIQFSPPADQHHPIHMQCPSPSHNSDSYSLHLRHIDHRSLPPSPNSSASDPITHVKAPFLAMPKNHEFIESFYQQELMKRLMPILLKLQYSHMYSCQPSSQFPDLHQPAASDNCTTSGRSSGKLLDAKLSGSPRAFVDDIMGLARREMERIINMSNREDAHSTVEAKESMEAIIYLMVLLKLAQNMMEHQNDDECLRNMHPFEVRPLLDRHVSMVINGKQHHNETFNPNESTKVHKYELGKIYAASIMQGYFLARVHQRFKLEKQLQQDTITMDAYLDNHGESLYTLSRIRCEQTINIIEQHVESIIGNTFVDIYTTKGVDPQQPTNRCSLVDNGAIDIQFSCIENLILHALAFGASLWDVECHYIPN